MKKSVLDRLANEGLVKRLGVLGFQREQGVFYRELPSKVIHILMISLDVRTTGTFQVLIGLNSRIISNMVEMNRMGLIGAQQVVPDGLSCNSGHWPCTDVSAASESLSRIAALIDTVIEPWFQQRKSLTALANEMDASQHGLRKAALFMAGDDLTSASRTLETYMERLRNPKPWYDPKWLAAEEMAVDLLLHEIEVAKQGREDNRNRSN